MPLPEAAAMAYFKRYAAETKYFLSAADMDSFTIPELLAMATSEELACWNQSLLHYAPIMGMELLRAEVAKLYAPLSTEQVLITSGIEEAIYLSLHSLLNPTAHAIVVTPCYESLKAIPLSLGIALTEVNLTLNSQSAWQLNLTQLANAITDSTQVIILNIPHNPTGYIPDYASYQAIIALAKQANLYLVVDEAYAYLEQDSALALPPACTQYPKAISIHGLSKAFALPGLRIGWMASQDLPLLTQTQHLKYYINATNSVPSEILALIALRNRTAILARNRRLIKANLELAAHYFRQFSRVVKWSAPPAGLLAFPQLQLPISIEEFAEQLVTASGVLLLPGSVYNYSGNHFRLGLGRATFPSAFMAFIKLLESFC